MNKAISTALLLAAGTALANAASIVTEVTFKSQNSPSTSGSVPWAGDGRGNGYYVGTSLSSEDLFSSFSWGGFVVDTTAQYKTQIMNQNENPLNKGCIIAYASDGTPAGYTLTFTFTAAQDVVISSLGFEFVGARNGGSFTNAYNNKDTSNTTIAIYNGSGVSQDAQLATTTQTISATSTAMVQGSTELPEGNNVSLDFDSITLSAGESITFTLDVDQSGMNTGLKSISIGATALPEPSAFGLLAGLGALALVAARRRRSRKAA